MDTATLAALGTAVTGIGGTCYAVYKLRTQDVDSIVKRQSAILDDMQQLNQELRSELADCRQERERLSRDR